MLLLGFHSLSAPEPLHAPLTSMQSPTQTIHARRPKRQYRGALKSEELKEAQILARNSPGRAQRRAQPERRTPEIQPAPPVNELMRAQLLRLHAVAP